MGEAKPIASLSGMLLARKGAARPAMRRPMPIGSNANGDEMHDDLGWNDMGYDVDPDQSAPMDYDHDSGRNPLANAVPEATPLVREQQQEIARQLEAQAEVGFESIARFPPLGPKSDRQIEVANASARHKQSVFAEPVLLQPVSVSSKVIAQIKPISRASAGSRGKSAFTLRLDKERHLKLRLACAVSNCSAQMLVTDALDAFLDEMPEIAQLAARVPAQK
jgi:hypothetical protein